MGIVVAAVAAFLVSGCLAVVLPRLKLPDVLAHARRGIAAWAGLAVGLGVLWVTHAALTLVLILLGASLIAGTVCGVLRLLGAHVLWRLLAHTLIVASTMALEWRRGDLFALVAVSATIGSIIVASVVEFATEAAQVSQAARTPAVLALAGCGYLAWIAVRLPNPGLLGVLLLVAAAMLPLAVLPGPAAAVDQVFPAILGATAWATGVYAWMANASPAMVCAPIVIVLADVSWTLGRRLVDDSLRARLSAAGSPGRFLDAWLRPGTDLVAQRVAVASSTRFALTWLLGATATALAVSLGTWYLQVRWLPAALSLLLIAGAWLISQLALLHHRRSQTVAHLVALSTAGILLAVASRLTDGRWSVVALPLVLILVAWPVGLVTARANSTIPARTRSAP